MTEFEMVRKEIPYSGTCYLLVKRYDATDFAGALEKQLQQARLEGAQTLYLGCRDGAFAEEERFCCGGHAFRYHSDFYMLKKRLAPENGPVFRMKRLDEGNAPLYAALHNEAFAAVPNAATVDALELARIRSGPCQAGFFMFGGEPVGTYELDLSEELPEIAAVAIRPSLRGAGRGHQAMRTLEQYLLSRGDGEVRLTVASANEAACTLYEKRGFSRISKLSRWFLLES